MEALSRVISSSSAGNEIREILRINLEVTDRRATWEEGEGKGKKKDKEDIRFCRETMVVSHRSAQFSVEIMFK